MYLLDYTFRIFSYCGYWEPETFKFASAKWKSSLYKLYHAVMFMLAIVFVTMKFLVILVTIYNNGMGSIEELTVTVVVFPDHAFALMKIFNLRNNKHKIFAIDSLFVKCHELYENTSFKGNVDEIQNKCEESCRYSICCNFFL